MKAHNIATILFFVILIALGYAFTVWTHSIHVPEEGEGAAAVEGAREADPAGPAGETSSAAASAAGSLIGAEETGAGEEGKADAEADEADEAEDTADAPSEQPETQAAEGEPAQEAAEAEPQAPAGETDEPEGEAAMAGRSQRVTLALARGAEAAEGAVSLTLFAGAEPLDVGNWRLSDSLGEAGDAGHVLYFDQGRRLAPGAPLTVVSSCGRDREGTLFWCLTHPESLWDAAEGAFYLRDDRGELALVCDSAQRDEDRVLYECVR